MASTVDHAFAVAYQGGVRRDLDADRCTVACQLLVAGVASGTNLNLDGSTAGPYLPVDMEQWHPGLFRYTSTGAPLTRGATYRAIYVPYVGGAAQATITQDFTAAGEATLGYPPAASHTYTTLGFRNICRRSLGLQEKTAGMDGQEPGSAHSLDIVNDAFERVWREHRWQFQMGEPVYGSLVAGQSRYPLPADFMELLSIATPGSRTHRWSVRPLESIRRMREMGYTSPVNETLYAVVSDPADAAGDAVSYAMEVFPTPTAYAQSGYVLDYYREYPKVTADDDAPPFPRGFHSLLKQAVRLESFEQENDPRAADEAGKFGGMLAAARDNDGRHVPTNLGSLVSRGWRGDDESPDFDHDPLTEITDD